MADSIAASAGFRGNLMVVFVEVKGTELDERVWWSLRIFDLFYKYRECNNLVVKNKMFVIVVDLDC